jgi:hypothetical protein
VCAAGRARSRRFTSERVPDTSTRRFAPFT